MRPTIVHVSRLPAADDPAMGEHLARGYEDFSPPIHDFPLSWWELALVRIGVVGLLAWVAGTVIVIAWLLMAYVLPAIPWGVAWVIHTAGQATWGAW